MSSAPPGPAARQQTNAKWHFARGIHARLVVAIMLVTLIVSLVGMFIDAQYDMKRIRQAVVENNLSRLMALKVDFVKVITDYTPDNAVDLVDRLSSFPDIHNVVLHDNNNNLVFRYDFHVSAPLVFPDIFEPDQSSVIIYGNDEILMHHTVTYGGKRYGWVSVRIKTVDIKEQYREYALAAVWLLFGTAIIALFLAVLAGHYFSRPIRNLAAFVRSVSHDHDFSRRLAVGQKGEIGELYDGVNVMLDEIEDGTREVQRLNESRVRNIIESAVDGVVSFNVAGKITYWSKQAETILGWSEKEVLGRSLADTVIPEHIRQQFYEDIERFLKTEEKDVSARRMAGLGLHRDGYEVPLEISISAVEESDGWTFNTFMRDVSAQKRAEHKMYEMQKQLLRRERLAAVGQLTATVAHELRNPMGTIQNTLYILTQKLARKEHGTADLVDRISRNVKRCDAIISELLDFTRDRDITLIPTVIDTWLGSVLHGYECPDGVELVCKLDSGATIPMDNAYFESAVINVLNNAVQAVVEKHSGGGGRVELGTVVENGRVGVVISDNGPGIAAEDREHVFEVLYSTKVYGVGLGLPTVKKVMEKHGGEVSLEPGFSGGLRVSLWLPVNNPSGGDNTL